MQKAHARYVLAKNQIYAAQETLKPYHNVWPSYQNDMEYYNDFVFTVSAPPNQIQEFTEYLSKQPDFGANISA